MICNLQCPEGISNMHHMLQPDSSPQFHDLLQELLNNLGFCHGLGAQVARAGQGTQQVLSVVDLLGQLLSTIK